MGKSVGKLDKKKISFAIIVASFTGIFIFLSFPLNNFSPTGHIINDMEGKKLVTKVLDGDTVIIEGGYSVRLLGIDADERGYPCYSSAKERLEELVLNEEVYVEADKEDQDQYKR